MWAQDAAAMYGYAGSSATDSQLTPFAEPANTIDPAGVAAQSGIDRRCTGRRGCCCPQGLRRSGRTAWWWTDFCGSGQLGFSREAVGTARVERTAARGHAPCRSAPSLPPRTRALETCWAACRWRVSEQAGPPVRRSQLRLPPYRHGPHTLRRLASPGRGSPAAGR
jgi:hypothetical protein